MNIVFQWNNPYWKNLRQNYSKSIIRYHKKLLIEGVKKWTYDHILYEILHAILQVLLIERMMANTLVNLICYLYNRFAS